MTYADRGIVEIGEWDDGTNVDESGTIEQQINDVGENGVFGVFVKESIPCEGGSTCESRQQIVTS